MAGGRATPSSVDSKSSTTADAVAGMNMEIDELVKSSLYRLTEGIPNYELKLMSSEAQACEDLLENEIKQLEEALAEERQKQQEQQKKKSKKKKTSSDTDKDGGSNDTDDGSKKQASLSPTNAVDIMLESEITPPDRYFTVSALLGRLRDDLATPLPPYSTKIRGGGTAAGGAGLQQPTLKKKKSTSGSGSGTGTPTNVDQGGGTAQQQTQQASSNNTTTGGDKGANTTKQQPLNGIEKQKRLLLLDKHPEYRREHETNTTLLTLWKKISTHKTSVVFRRPVNPKEAPSYAERILFPMDLSLVRKMIVGRMIKSYADLHIRIGLICHNCVKYNGRESDYGVVTREFEGIVDELIVNAVMKTSTSRSSSPATATASTAAANTAAGGSTAAAASTSKSPPADASATATTATAGGDGTAKTTTKERAASPKNTKASSSSSATAAAAAASTSSDNKGDTKKSAATNASSSSSGTSKK